MPLTNLEVQRARPAQKPFRLFDERGLYLEASPSGGKLWRWKYRFDGKEKRLAFGKFPDVPLAIARKKCDEAREILANGVDPSADRKIKKAERAERLSNSFEAVAREWFAKHSPGWAATHADKIIKRLENDVFPWLGKRPVSEISAPEILKVLRRIEGRGALDTAHRVHQNCGQVMRYAVATGRAMRDPSGDLRGALPPATHVNFAAITEPEQVGELLRAIDGFKGTFVVQCALRLAPMFFVRPGELRKARWADFDLDAADWRYHVTKTKTEHLVPLSKQAVEILRELNAKTGNREHVFPGRNPRKPMSDAAINAALRRMGYDTKSEITGHGFRAMARTILHQELHFAPELIEHQLAHRVPDSLGTAYNRTKFIDQRRAMMQSWSDYLERLKAGAKVIVIRGRPAFLREMPMLNGPEREVLTFNALLTILGRRSRRSIYDLMRRDPTLPRPRQIGSEFSVGWLRGEVMEWLNARPPVRCADVTQRSVSPRTGGSDSPVLTLANICQRFPRTCAFGDLARAALKRYLRHAQVSCAYPV